MGCPEQVIYKDEKEAGDWHGQAGTRNRERLITGTWVPVLGDDIIEQDGGDVNTQLCECINDHSVHSKMVVFTQCENYISIKLTLRKKMSDSRGSDV